MLLIKSKTIKILILVVTIALSSSCSKLPSTHKDLIFAIIRNPERTIDLCKNNSFEISDILNNALKNKDSIEILKCHFSSLINNYEVAEVEIITNNENRNDKLLYVYISPKNEKNKLNWIVFRFKDYENDWKKLDLITLPEFSSCKQKL